MDKEKNRWVLTKSATKSISMGILSLRSIWTLRTRNTISFSLSSVKTWPTMLLGSPEIVHRLHLKILLVILLKMILRRLGRCPGKTLAHCWSQKTWEQHRHQVVCPNLMSKCQKNLVPLYKRFHRPRNFERYSEKVLVRSKYKPSW